jgi:hypothetical protein
LFSSKRDGIGIPYYLFLAFLAASVFETNWLPFRLPSIFFLFVAALCAGVSFAHAFAGRYLRVPPLRIAGLPSDVLHFSRVHVFNERCALRGAPL